MRTVLSPTETPVTPVPGSTTRPGEVPSDDFRELDWKVVLDFAGMLLQVVLLACVTLMRTSQEEKSDDCQRKVGKGRLVRL
jgi:hypothetical protein